MVSEISTAEISKCKEFLALLVITAGHWWLFIATLVQDGTIVELSQQNDDEQQEENITWYL